MQFWDMAEAFSYSIDNDKKFRDALKKAASDVGDLTIPLTLISADFYKSEMAIFNLQGPGQYPDLAKSTKKQKLLNGGSIYPILRRSGALEKSVTAPNATGSINIITKTSLTIGSSLRSKAGAPYPTFLQEGTKHMPVRKFLFIGPEAPQFATSEQTGRLERWLGILNGFVDQKISILGSTRQT